MATISDLWAAFEEFQNIAAALDVRSYYGLALWSDGEGELFGNELVDNRWVQVTCWETFEEGIEKLNELTIRNKAAQDG